jgi:branched-chain amino acid transport system substrate-binding protein
MTGVVLGGYVPLDPDNRSMRAYRTSLARAYPTLQPGAAYHDPTYASYTAMEALASALEVTDGELGEGQAELRGALARLELELPQGAVRLDRNRQAIGEISLERIVRTASGRAQLEGLVTVENVEQRFGGLFTPETPPPSPVTPPCLKGSPPAWAR